MIAPCGFRCDQCLAFVDNARTPADRATGSAAWAQYWRLRVAPERMQCHGCAAGPVAGLEFPDVNCKFRRCVLEQGLTTCAECEEYPCATLDARMASCDRVVRRFGDTIPQHDFARFIAPYDCRATLEQLRKSPAARPSAKSPGRSRGGRRSKGR